MSTEAPRVGLLFPGQGAQRPGMGEAWRDCASWDLVPRVSEISGVDIEELLLTADEQTLRRTDLAQLAIFTTSLMAHREASARGVLGEVVCYAGHSLGEYVALTASGALPYEDAVRLVVARGRGMREAAENQSGTMAVLLGAPLESVEEAASTVRAGGPGVWVANINCPGQVVCSGTPEGLERLAELVVAPGVKVVSIPVGGAFHSPLMSPAADDLAKALTDARFAAAHAAVVANVDASAHSGADDWPDLMIRQLTSPVRWEESVRVLIGELGCTRLLELGPGTTLTSLLRRIDRSVSATALNSASAIAALAH
ncbi:ACP S-malonyltransferase [Streptomyces albipurpureus]|uniref:Malonyl CoA-acyl carrier protein transacylase n=1 Tax=Streptomyces albipurpureus TaxID=2897419 RepID=A0ABT0UKL7_9ACTN|nr:ACP S-malonyltransferase [Streptomyces sp. CWNU-1]MCM2387938.1 ACP S-malonyltransferase [Streptomyces sp. CWNU-1]